MGRQAPVLDTTRQQMVLAARFVAAAQRYWIGTYPTIRAEIRYLKYQADGIPDPRLRRLALETQDRKWGDLEGAAAFAAFIPRRHRACVARLLLTLQGIYDYADTLMEQPSRDQSANAIMLHSAMLAALKPGEPHANYYAHHTTDDDGGYLALLVDRCRAVVEQLPSYPLVAEAAHTNTWRIIDYQARINHDRERGHPSFVHWAESETPAGSGLNWWETGAACGSSLALLALLAAAAEQALTSSQAKAIEETYWPWANALHTLLDNLIDRAEDKQTQQHNLIDHYTSQAEMTDRLGLLASETVTRAHYAVPHHRLILAGMVALYLSDEQAWTGAAQPASERVSTATGTLVKPALLLLRARRLVLGS
jgi:tetraprenyl-beta-curcumene synthase